MGGIEIATGVLEEMEKAMKPDEAYENLMGACSSTAQALKQTISDVLRSRENIVITDVTSELQESLNKKIADFENAVSGCFTEKDIKTDLTNIKHPAFSNVIITEVDESVEEISATNTDSVIHNSKEEKCSTSSASVTVKKETPMGSEVNKKVDKGSTEVPIKKEYATESKSTQTIQVQVNVMKCSQLIVFVVYALQ